MVPLFVFKGCKYLHFAANQFSKWYGILGMPYYEEKTFTSELAER